MHEWMRDPQRRGEGLVCRNCGATEAEVEATQNLSACPAEGIVGED